MKSIKRFTHWIIWNIPATDKIVKAIPSEKTVYCFTIYALDCKISLKSSSTKRNSLGKQ